MKTKIYIFGEIGTSKNLFLGEVDQVTDCDHRIKFVSPWPKKFETNPLEPVLHICVKKGTKVKVLEHNDNEDPCIQLLNGKG